MKITFDNCRDCPFYVCNTSKDEYCYHPNFISQHPLILSSGLPVWCPMRNDSVTFSLRNRKNDFPYGRIIENEFYS